MSHLSDTNKRSTNSSTPSMSSPGEAAPAAGGDSQIERPTISSKSDVDSFIGKDKLLEQFQDQLKQFEEWHERRDWLAFHHHHYDWWMFPIDEISSRGSTYQLPVDVIHDLRKNEEFIKDLRRGVCLMVSSWGWDIENGQYFNKLDDKQKWSYWPVRLYKAGKCMRLFEQYDYYESLKKLALDIKKKEKLDFFSHTKNGKVDVIKQWEQMEATTSS